MKFLKSLFLTFAISLLMLLCVSANEPSSLKATKNAIESADFTVNIQSINTIEEVKEHLNRYVSCFAENGVEIFGIDIISFEPAISDTKDGDFSFTAELLCENYRITTKKIDGIIVSKPVSITLSSSNNTISEGESCTLNANIVNHSGEDIVWFESTSKNKAGNVLKETSDTLTVSPSSGTKYYYCTSNGAMSNTVAVNVTEPFVSVTDITLEDFPFVCGVSSEFKAVVLPENSTESTIIWKIISGDAFISLNKITAKQSGIITVEARVKEGGKDGNDFIKLFELYAEENNDPSMQISWDAYPISPKVITSVSFVSNSKKNVQITTLSDITANKALDDANIHAKTIIATAHIVSEELSDVTSVKLQFEGKYANKQVSVVALDREGNITHADATISDKAILDVPAGNISYIIATQNTNSFNLSFLFMLVPILPIALIPVFIRISKKD